MILFYLNPRLRNLQTNRFVVKSITRDTNGGLGFAETVFGQCEGGAEFGEGHGEILMMMAE